MPDDHTREPAEQGPDRYERSDASLKAILYFAAGLIVAAVLVHVLLAWYYVLLERSQPQLVVSPLAPPREVPPPPRLQVSPKGEMDLFLEQQLKLLNGYSLSEQEEGVVRIPIERAKELLLQRGLPTRGGPPPAVQPGPGVRGGMRAQPLRPATPGGRTPAAPQTQTHNHNQKGGTGATPPSP